MSDTRADTRGPDLDDQRPVDHPPAMRPWWAGYAAVAAAAVLLAIAVVWGRGFVRRGPELFLFAPPFVGVWEALWSPGLWWALAFAVLLVTWWVPIVERLKWGWLLLGSGVVALAWPVLLQGSAGWDSLYTVLGNRRAYLPTAQSIDSPAAFLRTFVERLPDYPTHVKGHPPGATLAHWFFDLIGGGRSDVLTASFLIIAASAAPAALLAMDRIAGRDAARRAAPFVGLAPAAIWIASSPDAMFMGVMAWSVALGAIAITAKGRWALAAGFGAGVLAGLSLSFSYGSMLLLAPLWALALLGGLRRRWAPLVPAAIGFAVIPGLFMSAGFNWFDGLAATHTAYLAGVAPERPDRYFVIANLAVLAVSVGPATVAGLAWLRDRAAWWLVGGALAGVIAADLSMLSKGEVERIWLPAVPFLVLATSAIAGRMARRGWLGVQLSVAMGLQIWLRSPW
ncbi:integral membrane protein [soil metagenome]